MPSNAELAELANSLFTIYNNFDHQASHFEIICASITGVLMARIESAAGSFELLEEEESDQTADAETS